MQCYLGHEVPEGDTECRAGHATTVSIRCEICGTETMDAADMPMAIELAKLHAKKHEQKTETEDRASGVSRFARRAEFKLPIILEKESREDFERKMVEVDMYKARTGLKDEEATFDLYNSCETPLKRKLMNSAKLEGKPHSAGFRQLFSEIQRLATSGQNKAIDVFEFRGLQQEEEELIADYESRLNAKARHCDFKNCACCDGRCGSNRREEETRTQIICGMRDQELQRTFLEKHEQFVTLESVLTAVRAKEMAVTQQQSLGSSTSRARGQANDEKFLSQRKVDPERKCAKDESPRKCKLCGFPPSAGSCRANGQSCNKCGRKGHFGSVCRSGAKGPRSFKAKTRETTEEDDPQSSESVFVGNNRVKQVC